MESVFDEIKIIAQSNIAANAILSLYVAEKISFEQLVLGVLRLQKVIIDGFKDDLSTAKACGID